MLAVLRFVSISDWKFQKKFKNTLWKSCACVPLRKDLIMYLAMSDWRCLRVNIWLKYRIFYVKISFRIKEYLNNLRRKGDMSPPKKPPHENYKMVPVLVRLFLESDLWVFIMTTMWRLFFQNYLNILLSGNQMPRMGLDFTYIFETRLFLLFCLILREGNSWTTLPGSIVDYQHPSILV